MDATGEKEAAYRELAAADAEAGEAIAHHTARLKHLQDTLAQVGALAGPAGASLPPGV